MQLKDPKHLLPETPGPTKSALIRAARALKCLIWRGAGTGQITVAKRPSRNSLCPCGSKMKYKNCCWTNNWKAPQ